MRTRRRVGPTRAPCGGCKQARPSQVLLSRGLLLCARGCAARVGSPCVHLLAHAPHNRKENLDERPDGFNLCHLDEHILFQARARPLCALTPHCIHHALKVAKFMLLEERERERERGAQRDCARIGSGERGEGLTLVPSHQNTWHLSCMRIANLMPRFASALLVWPPLLSCACDIHW